MELLSAIALGHDALGVLRIDLPEFHVLNLVVCSDMLKNLCHWLSLPFPCLFFILPQEEGTNTL
jgi:hypothetical protein